MPEASRINVPFSFRSWGRSLSYARDPMNCPIPSTPFKKTNPKRRRRAPTRLTFRMLFVNCLIVLFLYRVVWNFFRRIAHLVYHRRKKVLVRLQVFEKLAFLMFKLFLA